MKYRFCLYCLVFATPLAFAQKSKTQKGPVSDSEAAIKIAEVALIPVYGEKQIRSEEPFIAELKDNVWTVFGTLHCSDGKGGRTTVCAGGVAKVRISKKDGRVISMVHTE